MGIIDAEGLLNLLVRHEVTALSAPCACSFGFVFACNIRAPWGKVCQLVSMSVCQLVSMSVCQCISVSVGRYVRQAGGLAFVEMGDAVFHYILYGFAAFEN